jgi:hypothetical protein
MHHIAGGLGSITQTPQSPEVEMLYSCKELFSTGNDCMCWYKEVGWHVGIAVIPRPVGVGDDMKLMKLETRKELWIGVLRQERDTHVK